MYLVSHNQPSKIQAARSFNEALSTRPVCSPTIVTPDTSYARTSIIHNSPNTLCTRLYSSALLFIPPSKHHKIVFSSITTIEILESFRGDPVGQLKSLYIPTLRTIFIYPGRSLTLSKYEASGGIRVEKGTHLLNEISGIH